MFERWIIRKKVIDTSARTYLTDNHPDCDSLARDARIARPMAN